MKKTVCWLVLAACLLALVPGALADDPAGPSDWAAEGVREAVELGMVPKGLQSDWQQDLTRGEFADLLVRFLSVQYGYGAGTGLRYDEFMDDYLVRRPGANGKLLEMADYLPEEDPAQKHYYTWGYVLPNFVHVFDDIETAPKGEINLAYLLGVVKGRDASHYDPDGPITRQEAAALLARTYGVYGTLEPKAAEPFADAGAIASWAAEDVAAMAGWDILHGDEARVFSPLAHYTREQGVLTFLRLYKNMPVSRYNGTLAPLLTQEEVIKRCISSGPFTGGNVQYRADTELCTVLFISYGGVMHPPEPVIFLVYPDSTFRCVPGPGSPQGVQLTGSTLTFATGYFDQRNSLDLVTGTLTEGPVSETDQSHNSAETAMTIYPNDTYQCLLLNGLDEDWYQVTFYKEGIGEFALSCEKPEDAELKMEFAFRADSGEILPLSKESLVCAGGQTVCKLLWDVTAGTTYFVRVSGDSGTGSARYTLQARLSPLSPLRNEALLAQLGPSATVEGFYHRPFEELPQALRDRLTFVREEANAYGFAMILREYAAPGITVTTSQATEEGLRRWLDGQLSLPEGNEERSGTDEELRAEFEREKGREWLYSVDITDDSYATDFGLKVGATIEEAEALGYLFPLGQPLTTNGSAAYGDTWNHQLIIYTENGVVTKLSLNWGIGRYAGKYWDP